MKRIGVILIALSLSLLTQLSLFAGKTYFDEQGFFTNNQEDFYSETTADGFFAAANELDAEAEEDICDYSVSPPCKICAPNDTSRPVCRSADMPLTDAFPCLMLFAFGYGLILFKKSKRK